MKSIVARQHNFEAVLFVGYFIYLLAVLIVRNERIWRPKEDNLMFLSHLQEWAKNVQSTDTPKLLSRGSCAGELHIQDNEMFWNGWHEERQ